MAQTVTGDNDFLDDGAVGWIVQLDPASSDTNDTGLVNVEVEATTTDDDTAEVTVDTDLVTPGR